MAATVIHRRLAIAPAAGSEGALAETLDTGFPSSRNRAIP
jgi:hypothetical protein